MEEYNNSFMSPRLSLIDLLGRDYVNAVCSAKAFLEGEKQAFYLKIAEEKVNLYPDQYQLRNDDLLEYIGEKISQDLVPTVKGATTESFKDAENLRAAPLSGFGTTRVGEDGRLYLCSKCEHYHASLGHNFPGYKLIENAKKLGISNATHNNARGYICRILEQELICAANGMQKKDNHISEILKSKSPDTLNRVINLQTGSLVVEAGVKMMLARFYCVDDSFPEPSYHNRIPVFLVIGDYNGGLTANYHGTTVFTQMMREMWPGLSKRAQEQGMFLFVPVKINDFLDFKETIHKYDTGVYKVAGFLHELVLMNYGGIKLDEGFIKNTHQLCYERDIPTLVDEIQTCMWSPEFFLFREYNITPSLVTVGKGFPGGQYSASRLLLTASMDNLNQFGALVTNGQEELSSLAYLITMKFVQCNGDLMRRVGDYYKNELIRLKKKYENTIKEIEGHRHLSSLYFFDEKRAKKFVKILNDRCIDVSIQSYKANCPPSVITKLPIISTYKTVDFIIKKMEETLNKI